MRLIINNSVSQLEGLPIHRWKELRDVLSYEIDAGQSFFSGSRFRKRTLLGKHGHFPTGLCYLVQRYVTKNRLNVTTVDLRKQPKSAPGLFNPKFDYLPYPEQEKAVKTATKAHRGVIVMPTGSGKSYAMALLIATLQVKTLVVVPNLELKKQLMATFRSAFGETLDIVVENIDNPNLRHLTGFDCLIVDESHHVAAATYRKLNKTAWNGVYYRFFFTASPFRTRQEEELLMESVSGKVIYRLPYAQAVKRSIIVPLEAYYIDLPSTEFESFSWPTVYSRLVVNNEARNKVIADLMGQLAGHSTLLLVKEIAHGEALKALTGVEFANGQNDDTRRLILEFALGQRKHLIGTIGILGEGVDTKPAEYVILAGLGKSKNSIMQQCGRAFRTYPNKESAKVIIFRDRSHKWSEAHFKAQRKILLDEYSIKVVKL